MKKWEIPQVTVEKFLSNECVSACTPIPFSGNPKYAYIDWNPTDGSVSNSGAERLQRSNQTGHYSVSQDMPHGYYDNVMVYKVNPETGLSVAPSGSHSLDATYSFYNLAGEYVTVPLFVEVGLYDVYVGSRVDVQVYPSSQWDGGSTTDKTYS